MYCHDMPKIEGGKRAKGFETEGKPFVTIITAVLNGHATIEHTIKSVINQSFGRSEYLVIDGGSEDGTIEVLKKYDGDIDYWVSEHDCGIYDALNRGIALAAGEWIYFLGSDDKFADNDVLNRIFSSIHHSKFIYGNVIMTDSCTVYGGQFSKYKLCRQNICQQSIFYNRELFKTIGKFEMKYTLLADWHFNMLCFADRDSNPIFIDDIIALYSESGVSSMHTDKLFLKDQKYLIKKIFGYWYFFCTMVYYKLKLNKLF